MKYQKFIEDNFRIDDAKTGALIPFLFNPVQQKYYHELCRDYDIENSGLSNPSREVILKARREGFSSLILALFAADDLMQDNPTETLVISYRDDATKTFIKRYKNFILSFVESQGANADPKQIFALDNGGELVLAHNKARFYCGTASARTGGRGGVVHKLLFSEAAHYPDVEKMSASEIIEGTLRQVDVDAGWVFVESTANGFGNHYEQLWSLAKKGESRFKPRFYGWQEFYTPEQFAVIESEFTDKQMLKQEYPSNSSEAFITSGSSYFDNELIIALIAAAPQPKEIGVIALVNGESEYTPDRIGNLKIWEKPKPEASYVIGVDTAEGLEHGDYSVGVVIDNKTLKTVAKLSDHISPDRFATLLYALGVWYNNAYIGVESNKDGLWVVSELFKNGYANLYFREAIDDITNRVSRSLGFRTDDQTRRYILEGLQKLFNQRQDIWTNADFLNECLVFVKNSRGRPQAMSGKHDDEIFATAIAYEIRHHAPIELIATETAKTGNEYVQQRLNRLYGKREAVNAITQNDYI